MRVPRVFAIVLAIGITGSPTLRAQNLVSNGGFDTDLSGWTIDQSAQWSSLDAASSPSSGSVVLAHSTIPNQINQCLSVTPGMYQGRVKAYFPAGQSTTGIGVFRVWSFTSTNCSGPFDEVQELDIAPTAFNAWLPAAQYVRIPVGAQSASFQLFFQRNQTSGVFTGHYDDASLETSDGAVLLGANGRFQVETTWTTPPGQTGAGHGALLTTDTGDFWFFSATNIEMIVKVLDACSLNQRFWVFSGGLTNVQVTLKVTDRFKGTVKNYLNPQNTKYVAIQDTNAFACP